MKRAYFKDRASLYLELSSENTAPVWEAQAGIVNNLYEDGRVVGIGIERASEKEGLSSLRIEGFPEVMCTLWAARRIEAV